MRRIVGFPSMVHFAVTIVRHGETASNVDGLIQGQLDVPLNATGERQATDLGRWLVAVGRPPFSHVYCSDLIRAKRTAELIIQSYAERPPIRRYEPLLRERSFGCMEGRSIKDLKAEAAKHSLKVLNYNPPGSESLDQLKERARMFFHKLCREIEDEVCSDHLSNCLSPVESPGGLTLSSSSSPAPSPRLRHSSSGRRSARLLSAQLPSWPEEDDGLSVFHSANVDQPQPPQAAVSTADDRGDGEEETRQHGSDSIDSGVLVELPLSSMSESAAETAGETVGVKRSQAAPTSPVVRKASRVSVTSDDSAFPETEANVLVVSHGGPIRELITHLCVDHGCVLPDSCTGTNWSRKEGAKSVGSLTSRMNRSPPNTSASRFMVWWMPPSAPSSLSDDGTKQATPSFAAEVVCLELYSVDHLTLSSAVAPKAF